MPDAWVFGWDELLALVGLAVTGAIAYFGFQTFGRWKREKLEERRIEVALEALALTYESKYVFDNIRSPASYEHEWQDMPKPPDETEQERRRRGPFYAIRKRVVANREFFERVYKLQPRCMALFGKDAQDTFILLHKARRHIEVSSEMLMNKPPVANLAKSSGAALLAATLEWLWRFFTETNFADVGIAALTGALPRASPRRSE